MVRSVPAGECVTVFVGLSTLELRPAAGEEDKWYADNPGRAWKKAGLGISNDRRRVRSILARNAQRLILQNVDVEEQVVAWL